MSHNSFIFILDNIKYKEKITLHDFLLVNWEKD